MNTILNRQCDSIVDFSSNNSFNDVVSEKRRVIEEFMSKHRVGEPFVTSSHEFYMEDLAYKDVKCLEDLIGQFFEKFISPGLSIDINMFRQLQMDFEQDLHQQYTKFSLFETTDEILNDILPNNIEIPRNITTPTNLNLIWVPKGSSQTNTKIPYDYEKGLLGFPFLVWYEFVRLFEPFGMIKYSLTALKRLNNCRTASDFHDTFQFICKEYLMNYSVNVNNQEICKLIPYNRIIWEISDRNSDSDKFVGRKKHIYYSANVTIRNGKLELELNAPRTCLSKRYYRMYSSERFLQIKINKELDLEKLDEKKFTAFKNLLLHPLELAGRTYEFLYAKEGTLYYFATSGPSLDPVTILDAINMNVPIDRNANMTTAKFYSRISLGFSDSTAVMIFNNEQIRYNTPDIENTLGECLTDGCAAISLGAMREIAKLLDYRETPPVIQARIGGAKGIWFLDPQIKDPYEIRIDLRQSQTKYKLDADNQHLRSLDLVRIVKASDRPGALNSQLIRILENGGVPAKVFVEMIKENIKKIKDMFVGQDDPTLLRACIANAGNVMHRRIEEKMNNDDLSDYGSISEASDSGFSSVSISGFPDSVYEQCIEMLDAGFIPSTCPFLAKKLKYALKAQLATLASKFHIEIHLSRVLICIADPTSSLKNDEIFIQLDNDAGYDERGMRFGVIEGDVILSRNPCVLPSDIQKARAVQNPLLSKYCNVVIFPVKAQSREGPLAGKLSGGDYDGDRVFCCWDPRITEFFENSPVMETLPEVEDAFTKCTETVRDYLAPVKEEEQTKKIQQLILETYFKDKFTPRGMYDRFHRLQSSHFGVSDPKSIYLAQMAARLLDATKQGETLKPSVYIFDKKYNNLPVPYWMDKDKSKSNTKSVCILDDLKKIIDDEMSVVNSPEFSVVINPKCELDPHIHQFWLREFARACNMEDNSYRKDLELIINVTDSILRKYNSDIKKTLDEEEDLLFLEKNTQNTQNTQTNPGNSKRGKIRAISYRYTDEFINFPPVSRYESDILKHVDRTDANHDITLFELRLKAAALYIQSFTKGPEKEGCWKLAFRVLCGLKARMLESEKSDIVGGPRTIAYEVWKSLNVDRRWRRYDFVK